MKKTREKNMRLVPSDVEGQISEKINPSVVLRRKKQKVEKLWLIQYFQVRRHSRTLYLPLDPTTVRLHDIAKGDILKAVLLTLRKEPRPNEPVQEFSENENESIENERTDLGEGEF